MGFNKRFISKLIIKNYLENNLKLSTLFNADALIFMDDLSNLVYTWYTQNNQTEEIIKIKIKEYEDNFKQKHK